MHLQSCCCSFKKYIILLIDTWIHTFTSSLSAVQRKFYLATNTKPILHMFCVFLVMIDLRLSFVCYLMQIVFIYLHSTNIGNIRPLHTRLHGQGRLPKKKYLDIDVNFHKLISTAFHNSILIILNLFIIYSRFL